MSERIRRLIGACLLGILVISATAAPLAHAADEVLSSEAAMERGHTDECPVLHAESHCLKSGSPFTQTYADPGALRHPPDLSEAPPTSFVTLPTRVAADPHASRAPPQ